MLPAMTPSDTHPDVLRRQVELLRAAGFERRLELCLQLSQTAAELSLQALRDRMPGATEQEVRLRQAELNYGTELIDRVRRHLAARDQ